jgi:alkanesulfonate monooxygenase SsuD/methylene tetrahydromethanopterin reductase-like flavin-dependent oxidoreductase (luciferase family)
MHDQLREYHDRYSVFSHGTSDLSSRNADLMDELGLIDYFYERFAIVGNPDGVVKRLNELQTLGVTQVHLNAWNMEQVELIGTEVIPRLN